MSDSKLPELQVSATGHMPFDAAADSGFSLSSPILAFLLDMANDAVYIYDENRRILYVNDQAVSQSGFSRSQLLAMNIADLDPEFPASPPEVLRERAKKGERHVIETNHRTSDGQFFPVEISLSACLFSGDVYCAAFVRDISKRRQTQLHTRQLRFALDTASDAIYIHDRLGVIHYANDSACRALGYTSEELVGLHISDLDPVMAEHGLKAFENCGKSPVPPRQSLHRRKDGSTYPVEVVSSTTSFLGKESAVCFVKDISDRLEAQKALRESEQWFRMVADTSPVAMLISEAETGIIRYCNTQAAEMFGLARGELQKLTIKTLFLRAGLDEESCEDIIDREECRSQEIIMRAGDHFSWISYSSSTFLMESNRIVCSMLMDITEARELSNQLSYQATYDDLTGLVNRREFEDRLQEVIDIGVERKTENVLCYMDLDQFKIINDTCGHMAGDELLRQLAQELQKCVRRDDTLARLGGDEFAMLLENCSLGNAERVAYGVLQKVQNFRFVWQNQVFTVGVSIGMTKLLAEGDSISEVMRRADAACYAAKEAGRNRLHIFRFDDKELELRQVEMRWVTRLHNALDYGRYELWQQEIAEIYRHDRSDGTNAKNHFEVLVRMRDESSRLILPGVFLPAAERYDLVTKIDRWVVRALFDWLEQNPRELDRLGMCTINLSGKTLGDESFLNELIALLETSGVPASKICFEVTETAAIASLSSAIKFMTRLKAHGCAFALDDFGSGLSSFAYLKSLPVDFVKIDGFFVKDILADPVDRAMVKAIIDMTHALGKLTIAECVENDAILHELIDLDIDYVQGYGIAKPIPLY